MNILVLASFYPTDDLPMRGIFFKEQAEMCSNDQSLTLNILYNELRSLNMFRPSSLMKFRFQITEGFENNLFVTRRHYWNIIPTKLWLGRKLWIWSSYRLFLHYKKKHGLPDLLHVQGSFMAGELAHKINKRFKIPYLLNEHSNIFEGTLPGNKFKQLYHDIFQSAALIITVSHSLKKIIVSHFQLHSAAVTVVPNFIDTEYFKPISDSPGNPGKFTFLCICSLTKNKSVDRLIRSFHNTFYNDKNISLQIGGQGPELSSLMTLVDRLNLQSQVTFLGPLNRKEVRLHLNACNSLVLPSERETFGVVLIEALSMGKPVISTRCGGPEDIITPECGLLTEKTDMDLGASLQYLHTHIHKYDPIRIRNHSIEKFGEKQVVPLIQSIYKSLIYN